MKSINTLYKRNHKLFDYKVETAEKPLNYRINNGKPFEVFHKDGTSTMAYGYGEKKFTYSFKELLEQKEMDKIQREYNKERKALMEIINAMTNEELKNLLNK